MPYSWPLASWPKVERWGALGGGNTSLSNNRGMSASPGPCHTHTHTHTHTTTGRGKPLSHGRQAVHHRHTASHAAAGCSKHGCVRASTLATNRWRHAASFWQVGCDLRFQTQHRGLSRGCHTVYSDLAPVAASGSRGVGSRPHAVEASALQLRAAQLQRMSRNLVD